MAYPHSLLFTHSWSRNFKDKLVHSDTFGNSKCHFFPCRNCTSCCNVHKMDSFTSLVTGKSYNIRTFMNVVLLKLSFRKTFLGLQYTGCTHRQLRVRINEYHRVIHKQDSKSLVAPPVEITALARVSWNVKPDGLSIWRLWVHLAWKMTSTCYVSYNVTYTYAYDGHCSRL